MPPRRVLVTGATGFLGRWVTAGLAARNVAITTFSGRRLVAPAPDAVRDLRQAVGHVDAVCHLAAATTQQPGPPTRADYRRGNVDATRRLLDAAAIRPDLHVVFASTATIGGLTARQADLVADDRVAYAETKLAAEQLVHGFTALGGTGTTLRFCALGGPGCDPRRGAVAAALAAARDGAPFPVFGDATAGREYLNVVDAARAVIAALDRPPGGYLALQVGSGRLSTVDDVLAAAEAVTGRPIRRRYLPARGDVTDPPVSDLADADAALGWKPLRSDLVTIVHDQWSEMCAPGSVASQLDWGASTVSRAGRCPRGCCRGARCERPPRRPGAGS